jgi:hypothetical protein
LLSGDASEICRRILLPHAIRVHVLEMS